MSASHVKIAPWGGRSAALQRVRISLFRRTLANALRQAKTVSVRMQSLLIAFVLICWPVGKCSSVRLTPNIETLGEFRYRKALATESLGNFRYLG